MVLVLSAVFAVERVHRHCTCSPINFFWQNHSLSAKKKQSPLTSFLYSFLYFCQLIQPQNHIKWKCHWALFCVISHSAAVAAAIETRFGKLWKSVEEKTIDIFEMYRMYEVWWIEMTIFRQFKSLSVQVFWLICITSESIIASMFRFMKANSKNGAPKTRKSSHTT